MHIAICDDNIADRKQLERLLKRESDKRSAESGILYADSYGNAQALLANPMQYDVFYIDMCHTEGITGSDVARSLSELGVQAPIILCCSDIDYRTETFPEQLTKQLSFLEKPIKVSELSNSITQALEIKSHAPSMIELREEENTLYVPESDIMYAIEEGRYVTVHLTDGRLVRTTTTAMNLFAQIECHPSFMAPSQKVIINARYIQKLGFYKAVMTDGTSYKIHRECMAYAKYAFKEFHDLPIL